MEQLKFQSSDEFNNKTRKEIGNLFGADVVILGNITKFGDVFTINVRGVNVETGIATFADTLTFKKIETLPSIISKFVANLNLTKNVDNIDLINLKYKIFKNAGTGILIPSSVIFSISFPLIMVGVGLFSYGDYILRQHPEYYGADNYMEYQNESWYREAQSYFSAGFYMIIPNAVISSIQLIMGIVSIPILVHSVKLKKQIFGIEKLDIYPYISMNDNFRIGLIFSIF